MSKPRQPTPIAPTANEPDLVPAPSPNGRQELLNRPLSTDRAQLVATHSLHPRDYPTNLPDTPWGRAMRVNAENTPELTISEQAYVRFAVTYYYAHPSEMVDEETGEVTQVCRLVLITAEGRCFASTSEFVRKRMGSYIGHFGPGPWTEDNVIQISERKNRARTRTYHELQVIIGAPTQ